MIYKQLITKSWKQINILNIRITKHKTVTTYFIRIATERGHLQIVKHLLRHGADSNFVYTSTTQHSYTSLYLAVEIQHEQQINKLLLSKNAM